MTYHIAGLSTSLAADVSAGGRSYSLCAVCVCHSKEGYSYVFSRWISREISPFHSDRIVLLQNPLHYSSITHGGLLHTPPPQWCSSTRIGAAQSPSALLSLDWRFNSSFRAPQSPPRPRLGAPLFHSSLSTSLHFRRCSAWMCAAQDRHSSIPVGAPWPGFAPLNFIPHSSINISTPLGHTALHIRNSFFPGGATLFLPNSSNWHWNSILIDCELTSQFQPFTYHKSSQTTLEFNFTRSPGSTH